MDSPQPNTPLGSTTTQSSHTASSMPIRRHGVFMGRFGLRAGWGILIFLELFILFTTTFAGGKIVFHLPPIFSQHQQAPQITQNHSEQPPALAASTAEFAPGPVARGEALQLAALGLAAWLLSIFERRRVAVYGIGRNRIMDFIPGALWGILTLSLLIILLRACHLLVFDSLALHGVAILRYGLEWACVFTLVGLLEEYLLRGYLQYTLMRGLFGLGEKISRTHARSVAFWMAASILSILFACLHLGNSGENAMGIVMVFVAGIVFSFALWKTGSLWWAIGFHMSWDWAQSFLYGVPDSGNVSAGRLFLTHPVGKTILSGGSDGPEGSLLVIPVLLLVMVAIHFARPGTQPALQPIPSTPEPTSTSAQPAV